MKDLVIDNKTYTSRLILGTGKYKSFEETKKVIDASGAEMVTVAIRRMNIGQDNSSPNLLDTLDPSDYTILPNTAGCYTAKDAVRTCKIASEILDGEKLVKLEVLGDEKTLYPNVTETIKAAEELIKDDYKIMVYTNDDPIISLELEKIGCIVVMPLASPIGSGLGVQNKYNILTIVENASVPIVVDAGVGTASDASIVMELGCDGVLMNTAIACAKNPAMMAEAMKHAVIAGHNAYHAGRIPKRRYASPSSPSRGILTDDD